MCVAEADESIPRPGSPDNQGPRDDPAMRSGLVEGAHAGVFAARSPAGARGRPSVEIPQVVVRYRRVRLYLFADAVAGWIVAMAALIGRMPSVYRRRGTSGAAEPDERLLRLSVSIRALAQALRDNPALASEQRTRMLSMIVDQTHRFERIIGGSPKPGSQAT